MQVWFAWAKQNTKCALGSCERLVEKGSKVVKGSQYRENKWAARFTWHPECYLLQGIVYLDSNPPLPTTHGTKGGRHPTLQLDKAGRRVRYTILGRIYRLQTNKEMFINLGLWWRVEETEERINLLVKELEPYGGTPSHWKHNTKTGTTE